MRLLISILRWIHIFIFFIITFALIFSFIATTDGKYVYVFNYKQKNQCKYFIATRHKCGSCGLTRGWIEESQFNFNNALELNKNTTRTYLSAIIFFISSLFYIFLFRKQNSTRQLLILLGLFLILILGWADVVIINIQLGTFKQI